MEKETKNTQEPRFEITKDNILHCLMHAATREDIAELRVENKANIGELRQEIKADINKLDNKIERIADKLDSKLNKHFMWLTGLMLGGFSTLAIMMFNFMKMKF